MHGTERRRVGAAQEIGRISQPRLSGCGRVSHHRLRPPAAPSRSFPEESTRRRPPSSWLSDVRDAEQAVQRLVKVPSRRANSTRWWTSASTLAQARLASSTLLKALNSGRYEAAAEQLLRWDLAGSEVNTGLKERREAEFALWRGNENKQEGSGLIPLHLLIRTQEAGRAAAAPSAAISETSNRSSGFRYPLRRNQSSIAVLSRSSGTLLPASSNPSPTGSVSSKTASLVKLRIAKLSIQRIGHACRPPAESTRSMEIRRANMLPLYRIHRSRHL